MKRINIPIKYSPDDLYDELLEKGSYNEIFIQNLLRNNIKSVYATKEILSGKQLEIEIYPEFFKGQAGAPVKKKVNKDVQDNLNDKNARKQVNRLIECNFTVNDIWITLTYNQDKRPEDMKSAIKNMQNFIRRINYRRKKLGLSKCRYIYITEHSPDSKIPWHHHMIMDGDMDRDIIEECWKLGDRIETKKLVPDENGLVGMANYITKCREKSQKRWNSSVGLIKPKVTVNHYKFKRKKVHNMVLNQNIIQELMEDTYKNYKYTESEVRHNNFNGYWYIYTRMRRRE